jgi:hypothetical protein
MRTNTKVVERRYRFRSADSFTAGGIETLNMSREAILILIFCANPNLQ